MDEMDWKLMKWIGNDWGTNWNGGLKNKALRLNASLNQIKRIIIIR